MSFLSSLSHWLVETLEPYGAPGLMLIAILDSSFLSFPEVNDFALMALSIRNHSSMWGLAAMTVLGSVIGCTLLYTVGRKGGEALLTKRFAAEKVSRVREWYDKYGMLAVIVPSLLPPPLPFKIFVLSAGAFRISWTRFIVAVAIGRSIRYFTEGMLAVKYGEQATQIVKDNSARVGLILASLIVLGTLVYVYSRRRRVSSGVVLLPLIGALFLSGCVKTQNIPVNERMLKSYPFTTEQALAKLGQVSKSVQSIQASLRLEGTAMMEDKSKTSPPLDGTLIMQRPYNIYLNTSYWVPVFEMRSDGKDYEVYVTEKKRVYRGKEDGPPSKPLADLGDLSNRLVNVRPKQILEALILDLTPLLSDNSITKSGSVLPVAKDRRRYLLLDFTDVSQQPRGRLLQRIWFDLSMEQPEVVRRQTFNKDGTVETDTSYSAFQPVGPDKVNFPSEIELQSVESDTILRVKLDPKKTEINGSVDTDAFLLSTHTGAQVITFEPKDLVSQQR